MDFEVIIADDNMSPTEPFVRRLEKKYPDARVKLFSEIRPCLDYIFANMSKKMIVFLDCKFDFGLQGIDALKKIREKTSLLYIIMMSANSPLQLQSADIIEMINNKGIYFINNSDMQQAEKIIEQIKYNWNTNFDCVFEQWILQHEDIADKIFIFKGQDKYTLRMILNEIRLGTGFGKDIEKIMYKSTIQSLLDSKLND